MEMYEVRTVYTLELLVEGVVEAKSKAEAEDLFSDIVRDRYDLVFNQTKLLEEMTDVEKVNENNYE